MNIIQKIFDKSSSEIVIPVTGMSCAHCVNSVKNALQEMDGAASAQVDLASGTATVKYDSKRVSPPQLVDQINAAGYDAALTEDNA